MVRESHLHTVICVIKCQFKSLEFTDWTFPIGPLRCLPVCVCLIGSFSSQFIVRYVYFLFLFLQDEGISTGFYSVLINAGFLEWTSSASHPSSLLSGRESPSRPTLGLNQAHCPGDGQAGPRTLISWGCLPFAAVQWTELRAAHWCTVVIWGGKTFLLM